MIEIDESDLEELLLHKIILEQLMDKFHIENLKDIDEIDYYRAVQEAKSALYEIKYGQGV